MNTALAPTPIAFDVEAIRREFPILARTVHGKPLAYLDNGASAQRPRSVIAAVDEYERMHHANIHRGVHTLSQEATGLYEGARERIARFINARSPREIVFVRGTTEAINLVAQSLLVYAFLADVLTGMSVSEARTAIESALISQLPDSQVLQKFR